jgi:predicted DNA-binding transcriptional regulator AlpA
VKFKFFRGKTLQENYITMTQYAELTGVSRPAVLYWIKSGSLPPSCLVVKDGREMIDLNKTVELGVFEQHNKLNGFKNTPLALEIEDTDVSAQTSEQQGASAPWVNATKPIVKESERYITKIKYAELIGRNRSNITRWIVKGEIPADCVVKHDGKEKLDLHRLKELGIYERHILSSGLDSKDLETNESEASDNENLLRATNSATVQQTEEEKVSSHAMVAKTEAQAKVLSLTAKIAANDSHKPNTKFRTKSDEEREFFEEERKARLQKMKAEAAIADMNQKRAEGKLLDAEKFEDLVVDLFSNFNTYFAQFSEQSAASLYGLNDLQSMKSILDQRLDAMRERIREEIERKKMEAQRLIALQTKPLKF